MYIKYVLSVFVSLVMINSILVAKTKVVKQDSVRMLVEKVKTAPPSERRVLMNELKVKLRSMHQHTRKEVMLELRASFNKEQMSSHHTGMKSNMHHQNTMSMSQSKNMQEHMQGDRIPTQKPPEQRPPGRIPKGGK